MAVSKGEGRQHNSQKKKTRREREGEVTHAFEDTQSEWEAGWVAVVRPREGWCSGERRVLGRNMRDETAGTGWKNSDLGKFLSR